MAGLPKKYFKMFPGNLKKGWAAFKAAKGGGHAAKPKKHSTKRKVAVAMGKAKRAGGKVKRGAKRIMSSGPGQVLKTAAVSVAGGVVTSYGINNIPKVRELSPGYKAAVQAGLGLAAVFFGKKKIIKDLGVGAVIAAAFSASKSVLKINPLAGPGSQATLSPSQMARLTMSRPASVSMNRPAASVSMNRPAAVSMGGRPLNSGWGAGGWGNN